MKIRLCIFSAITALFTYSGLNAQVLSVNISGQGASYTVGNEISFSVEFTNVTDLVDVPSGNGVTQAQIDAANQINTDNTAFDIQPVATFTGTDIYGNVFSFAAILNGPATFNLAPEGTITLQGAVTIPRDGTLHTPTQNGHRINVSYTYVDEGNPLGPDQSNSLSNVLVDVPANLIITDLSYPFGTFKGGDIIQITVSVQNERPSGTGSNTVVRPLRPQDNFFTDLLITPDASLVTGDMLEPVDESLLPVNDFLLGFFTLEGDQPLLRPIDGQTRVRHIEVSGTPEQIIDGSRNYWPQPDDGFLDIGETVAVSYEVMIPHNYSGSYYVAARTDSRNNITELGEPFDFNNTSVHLNDNYEVDSSTPGIIIEPSNSLDTLPVSEVTDSDGGLVSGADADSDVPSVSEDGTWIAFESEATNLDPNLQGTGNYNIYLRNSLTGEVELISRNNLGAIANADSRNPAISADGKYIAFESKATNLVSGARGANSQIYVYERENQSVTRVSISSQGIPANGNCMRPSIDENGRIIVFESTASNLDLGANDIYRNQLETQQKKQVFLHNRDVSGDTNFTTNYGTFLVSELDDVVSNSDAEEPKVSLNGDVVVFASAATYPNTLANGLSQIWMRDIVNGVPSGDISLVSLNDLGTAAGNGDSDQPAINGGKATPEYGLQIAFSSLATNLVANDTNNVSDIFVRNFDPDLLVPSTKRVSLSNPKASYGTITFSDVDLDNRADNLALNQPSPFDRIALSDGSTNAVFVFGVNVAIGANIGETRSNLVAAINASNLNIVAYASDPAGHTPSIMLYNEIPGALGNQAIVYTPVNPVNSAIIEVTGMSDGGTQTGIFTESYELGVAFGSRQPSLDRTGVKVAFRSLVNSISVASADTRFIKSDDTAINPTTGTPGTGEIIRSISTGSSKVYYIDRDIDSSGALDTPGNTDTVCASVNQFGGPTIEVTGSGSSGSSRVPAFSADGRFIAFASDSTNTGGLRFTQNNQRPLDDNNKRDVFLHSIPTIAPILEVDPNPPFVVITNPTDGSTIDFSSPVFLNAGAFGFDESTNLYGSSGVDTVEFFVNGESVGLDNQAPFSVLYQPTSDENLRIFAKVTDKHEDSNGNPNVESSDVVNVAVTVSPYETTLLQLVTPGVTNGDTYSVGDGITLKSNILDTANSAQFTESFELSSVRYLVNGVVAYVTEDISNNTDAFEHRYTFASAGTTTITAQATYNLRSASSTLTRSVFSESLTFDIVPVDIANNDRDFLNDAFQRLFGRAPTDNEIEDGLRILNSSGQTRASYIATLLNSYSAENSEIAGLIYRTMTGEWPDKEELAQAIIDLSQGSDANALTNALLPEYESRFSSLNTDLGFLQQVFFNKHGVTLSPQSQIRLSDVLAGADTTINDRTVPGYQGDKITYYTQFALDNDTSGLIGPSGLPLSNLHLYEMPNSPIDDLRIALAINAFLEVNPTDELVASYSGMSLVQALERILSGGSVSSALASASSLGSDWYDSSWFGMFNKPSESSNWVYSWRLGWVYEASASTSSAAWFYSDKLKAWLWSGSGLNGFYYHSSQSRKTWTYLLPAEADASGAWLYYFDTEQWQLVRP